MNTHKHRFRIMVLLVGAVLVPAITVSQFHCAALIRYIPEALTANTYASAGDKDLGIVRLRYATIVVRNYDEALHWYTNVLSLEKTEEGTFGTDKRWLVVAPRGRKDVGIILEIAKPFSPSDSIHNYEARIGKETRWVFEVEDCHKFYELASKRGVKFVETPVDQVWGVTEAMFEDLYGNVFVAQSPRPKVDTSRR